MQHPLPHKYEFSSIVLDVRAINRNLYLKNASHRLGMPKAADITKARALATRRGKHLKLNKSYGHELINWGMSVYRQHLPCAAAYREARFELMRS